ncbi:DUF397 domain-containing protein [Streptomyces sp. NPDC003077]|uniref:DUF397 domain-containing protein n=1 Tax=Streptomyces sp. NPDC003077 TaxID=3154443 RepID=UPI0033AB4F9F
MKAWKNVHIQWRKSSYSTDADGTNCLEIAAYHSGIALRESEEPEVVIAMTQEQMRGFLANIYAGGIDGSI